MKLINKILLSSFLLTQTHISFGSENNKNYHPVAQENTQLQTQREKDLKKTSRKTPTRDMESSSWRQAQQKTPLNQKLTREELAESRWRDDIDITEPIETPSIQRHDSSTEKTKKQEIKISFAHALTKPQKKETHTYVWNVLTKTIKKPLKLQK